MDYQAADIFIKAIGLALTVGNTAAVVVLWVGSRGRATKDAIDRVERKASEDLRSHDQRLIVVEQRLVHAISRQDLDLAIAPIYDLVRKSESSTASIEALLRKLDEEQRDFRNLILKRGIEK